ncbi:MAG: hypothetical protein JWR37_226 [Mycobacterium sp.]|nr:hypothetical protein [Mycobacterium sp.]
MSVMDLTITGVDMCRMSLSGPSVTVRLHPGGSRAER